ncbi:CLIP domain-containing serine protease HP8-like isoform X2 [Bicyclus anynana]|nr:CLIP domain-containing serine protease HP8-like isoform X2 [Bicyclus anynana]
MRRCFDCVSIKSCESALTFARQLYDGTLPSEKRNFMLNSMCGFDAQQLPKICCSDFNVVRTETRGALPESIENHRNVGLLPSTCGDIEGSRIIGGEVAKLYEFPWMTLIIYNTSMGLDFRCGGSIINTRYILTAAHCVIHNGVYKKIVAVRIGEFDYSSDIDCQGHSINQICETKIQDIDVEKIIPHENFNEQFPITADIALLRLKDPIIIQNNAAPICLPLYNNLRDVHLAGLSGTVAGWGTTENRTGSTVLMKVEIPIKSGETCSSYYNKYENQKRLEKAFCAGAIKKDSCSGDSGGPLMIESDFNGSLRLVQYGVVSFGPSACGSQYPGVYTDVSKYMDWILDNIKE